MSDRIATVVILAEDLRSANFLRRYLQRAISPRKIRDVIAPRGKGDAKIFVRGQYPIEVAEQRRRVHGKNRNQSLLTHVDADVDSVQARHAELADALKNAEQEPRGPHELIAIVAPKRHTETWLYGLTGDAVDELYDCKRDPDRRFHRDADTLLKDAASVLFELTRNNAPAPPANLPSLTSAIVEFRRFE